MTASQKQRRYNHTVHGGKRSHGLSDGAEEAPRNLSQTERHVTLPNGRDENRPRNRPKTVPYKRPVAARSGPLNRLKVFRYRFLRRTA